MSGFTHLHVHSHYSLLDGLPRVKPLVQTAKKMGFEAMALTDSGVMYGAIEFYKICLAEGIKPIIGFEAYICKRSMEDKEIQIDKEYFSLVLLAENYDGYRNLIKLCSLGHTTGYFDGKPRIDKEILKKYSKNIIALSGDILGEVPQLLKQNKLREAKEVALQYNDIFGIDNFYLELQDHPAIEGQIDVNTKMIQLAKDTSIPLVVTRDVHYLNTDDAEAQDILRCISNGWQVGQTNREDFRQVDRSLNSGVDITSRFRHVPEALENTGKIADRINIVIELDNWHFAPVEVTEGKTHDEVLRDMAFNSVEKFMLLTKVVEDRINYELEIIASKGYAPYFLCVADYVKYAKDNGIVEATRGSAAGSLVSYVIGITTVDPMRFKLPFERFLNPFRPSPPDVDTDFADDRRDEMIKYVTDKYGKDKVAQIITFGTMAARASVRDVGRALGFSYNFCDQVAKLIPMGSQGFAMTIERALKEEPDLKKLYETNADVKRLLDLAQKVEGCARHTSIHAAGVVISPTALTDFIPIQYETGGDRIITQYSMYDVEAAGVLKNDFLGIRNLSILGKAVEFVEKTTGEHVDIYTLPFDDKKTYEMLSRGETMGVFQLASSGMTRWIKELEPTTIDHIMAMVALYRPGPMDFIPEYIKRRHHPETIDYPHPDTRDILEASLGLLIYQDDIMLTAIKLAGYDWLEADKFRKAMGKKIPELMEEQANHFKEGCIKNNIPKNIVDDLWKRIEPFASYGFNKSHSASYGVVAYQTAYMKANYPVQYMTAVLQAEFGDAEKVSAIVAECKRMNIEVIPPDVNESFRNFAMVSKPGQKGRIRFGLSAIKNVGEHICGVIYRERKENGSYKDLEDFLIRVKDKDLNKKSLESLVQCGALDCFGIDRGVLVANTETILYFVKSSRDKLSSQQDSLFSGTTITLDDKVILKDASQATLDQKLIWEKNLLGLYVSSHPFNYYKEVLGDVVVDLSKIEEYARDKMVVVGGIIESVKKKITKKGSVMMFATIQDLTGSMELLVFPKTYELTQSSWVEGNILCVVGKTPREKGDNKLFVEKVYVLDKQNVAGVAGLFSLSDSVNDESEKKEKYIVVKMNKEELKDNTSVLKEIFSRYSGPYLLYMQINGNVIKTQTFVDACPELIHEVESLLGADRVSLG
ncbi:MAG: DNA polymerase III subunit alpha [bacterium]|nr:DNA polymerase III subunit alpha [bacterium]